MNLEQLAKLTHEVNRAYCSAIGDDSQLAWENAPEWQTDSARNGVRFHLENPGSPPSRSHEEWLAQKEAEGWVYGPEKDPEKKTHHCMVPYEELPAEQRVKDTLFSVVVDSCKGLIESER